MKQQKTQNPHKLTTDCSQCWHPVHRVAEKGSSLTCISYTCSRTAKFVVWLQKQVVESGRDVTTEQPAVDHIPPASGLTCSKKTEKKYGNYHPLQQKAKVLREFHSPRRSKVERKKKRVSETGLHMDFLLAHPASQQVCLIHQACTRKYV